MEKLFGQRQGTYHVVGTTALADRPTLVLGWTAPTGFVADRFNVDVFDLRLADKPHHLEPPQG